MYINGWNDILSISASDSQSSVLTCPTLFKYENIKSWIRISVGNWSRGTWRLLPIINISTRYVSVYHILDCLYYTGWLIISILFYTCCLISCCFRIQHLNHSFPVSITAIVSWWRIRIDWFLRNPLEKSTLHVLHVINEIIVFDFFNIFPFSGLNLSRSKGELTFSHSIDANINARIKSD